MKRMILMTLMGAMAFSGSVTSTQAAGVFPYEVQRHTLEMVQMAADKEP